MDYLGLGPKLTRIQIVTGNFQNRIQDIFAWLHAFGSSRFKDARQSKFVEEANNQGFATGIATQKPGLGSVEDFIDSIFYDFDRTGRKPSLHGYFLGRCFSAISVISFSVSWLSFSQASRALVTSFRC